MAGGGESRFRFELSRLELAGLIVSTAASLFIVFLLGLYAGRGLGGQRLEEAERVVRLPVAPAAAEETPGAEADLTFDDTLGDDDHPTRLAADGARAADRDAASGGAHVALPERAPEVAPGAPAVVRTPEARLAVALAAPHASAIPPAAALPAGNGGAWSVQVTATREPQTANDMVKRLRARGFDAYIVRARRDGAIFYRVRVGHFPSMEYASQLVSRLRRERGVPEAFVASD